MISSKFPKSISLNTIRSAGDLVVFYDFLAISGFFSDFKKFTKYRQVTSTPKTLRKLAWNHLTVLWLKFEKNRRFLFLPGPSPNYDISQIQFTIGSFAWYSCAKVWWKPWDFTDRNKRQKSPNFFIFRCFRALFRNISWPWKFHAFFVWKWQREGQMCPRETHLPG